MTTIWEHSTARDGALLVMLAIADFADDSGKAYPSVKTLATKARLSERQVQRVLLELVESGELTINRNAGPYGCNIYRVTNLRGDKLSPVTFDTEGVTLATKGGDTHVTRTVSEPSIEPSTEPSNQSIASEVIEHLNKATGHGFRGAVNIQYVVARIKEGASKDDCLRVIDAKAAEWASDEKMKSYLRPSTLFGKTNFWQYEGMLASVQVEEPIL